MSRVAQLLTLCVACALAACGSDDKVQILLFQASPDAIEAGQSTKLVFAVEPADAKLTITGLSDLTGKTEAQVMPATTTSYQLTATKGGATASRMVTVTVGATAAAAIKVEPATLAPAAGDALPVTLTVLASDGKPASGFRGTLHLTSTDAKAQLPGDIVFTAAEAGVKQVMVTLQTAGTSTLIATDVTGKVGTSGAATLTVRPGAVNRYQLSDLPANAIAGQPLVLTITVLDGFGNVATNYGGQVRFASTDPTDVLPPAGAFTAGVRTVDLAFTRSGSHVAQVEDPSAAIPFATTTRVAVGSAAAFRVDIAQANQATTAGIPEAFTATVFDFFHNVVTGYTGTLHFAATDPAAVLPADFTFGAGDAGTHDFQATLKTAGKVTVSASDAVAAAVTGSTTWTVGAAAAVSCVTGQAPAARVAGTLAALTITARDAFGNQATGYTGTVRLTASDARATLPADTTYGATDAGSHAFSVTLITTGNQIVTATDLANPQIQCSAPIAITPAAPKLVLSVPASANAGYAVGVGVEVRDLFDNAIPTFAGTVTFASTDHGSGAVSPGPITFTGSEGGLASTTTTFVTPGLQTLSATSSGSPLASGSATATVRGLSYAGPTTGRVRLVQNLARSNAQVIQLDLVANERLEVSSFFSGGPGPFGAGMNLPLDTTRVTGDATLFLPGAALPLGTGIAATLGRIGSDHVLYTVVSSKRVPGFNFFQSTDIQAGQVFYSVRLKLTPAGTSGLVFDGADLSPLYRAAVRDQYGDDVVSQGDIGVGKLEVR